MPFVGQVLGFRRVVVVKGPFIGLAEGFRRVLSCSGIFLGLCFSAQSAPSDVRVWDSRALRIGIAAQGNITWVGIVGGISDRDRGQLAATRCCG